MAHQEIEAGADAPEVETTIEEAAALLNDNPVIEEEAEEAPIEASEPVEESEAEVEVEAEDAQDETEEEVEVVPAIDAPISWSNEQKEVFASLPPEAQQVIVERESERDSGFQKKSTELAEQRKELEAHIEQVNNQGLQYHQAMETMLQQNMQLPDQTLLDPNSENYNPNLFQEQRMQFNERQAQLQQHQRDVENYQALQAQKEELAAKQRLVDRDETLKNELLPEFAKPEYQSDLRAFAEQQGFDDADFQEATAPQIVLLDMAMKYSKLKSKQPLVKDQVKVVPKVQKPGTSNKANPRQLAAKRLKEKGSIADAAFLLNPH